MSDHIVQQFNHSEDGPQDDGFLNRRFPEIEHIISQINQIVSEGGRIARYYFKNNCLTIKTYNPETDTEFIMFSIKKNGYTDKYMFEQALEYINSNSGVTYKINWRKNKKNFQSIFRGNNLKDVIYKFMSDKNNHDYLIQKVELLSNNDVNVEPEEEIQEIITTKGPIVDSDVIMKESKLILLITSDYSSSSHTVHFTYYIDDNGSYALNIYTSHTIRRDVFLLYSVNSEEKDLMKAKIDMLEKATKFLKKQIDPRCWITYIVQWKYNEDDTITTSQFFDYTVEKVAEKIFTCNKNITVISMTYKSIPIS